MAPIYTTVKLGSRQKSPLPFELNGLKNQAPSQIHALNIHGKALARELAYDGYRTNIDAFIYATLSGKRVATCLEAYGPIDNGKYFLPIPKPGFAYCPVKKVEVEKLEKLAKKINPAAEVRSPKKAPPFILSPAPPTDIAMLKQLAVTHSMIFSCPANHIPPSAFLTMSFLETMIDGFLRVNTYPAFKTRPLEADLWELRFSNIDGFTHDLVDDKRDEGDKKRGREEYSNSVQRKKWKMQKDGMEVDEEVCPDWEEEDPETESYSVTTGVDQVFMAKPSPFPPGTNITSYAGIPNLSGMAFPYFEGMVLPDFSTLKSTMINFFFRCLGGDMDQCKARVKDSKSDLNHLSLTPYGKALSHVCLGMRLALETQTRLSLIVDNGEYRGFTLQGEGFAVYDGSSWYVPESHEELFKSVSFMDPSEKAITELLGLLDDLRVADASNVPVAWGRESFSNIDFLVENLGKVKFSIENEEKVKARANDLLRKINFRGGESFIRIEPSSIHGALLVLTSDAEPELRFPFYLPSFQTDLSSKVFRVMTKFGPDAISFWNSSKGDKYSVEPVEADVGKGKKRAKSVEEVFPEPPPEIIVQIKPLTQCIQDWRTVVEARGIKQDLKERARDYRCHVLKNEQVRKDIWTALCQVGRLEAPKKKKKVVETAANVDDAFDSLFG